MKKSKARDVQLKANAHTTGISTGLAAAFGGGNSVPAWKKNLDLTEPEQERLKYVGGPTGEELEK